MEHPTDIEIVLGFVVTNGAGVIGLVALCVGSAYSIVIGIALLAVFVYGWCRALNSELPWG